MKIFKNKFFIGAIMCSFLCILFSLYRLGHHYIQIKIDDIPLSYEEISYVFKDERIIVTHLDKDGKIQIPWSLFEGKSAIMFNLKDKNYFFKTPRFGYIVYNLNTKTNISKTTYVYDFGVIKFSNSLEMGSIKNGIPKN